MKKFSRVIISVIILIIISGISFLILFYFKNPWGKPVSTTAEKIKKANDYINNSLYPSGSNMYLQVYPNKDFITIDDYPELKEIVTNLNGSIKIKEEYKPDMFSFDIPHRATFHWVGDTQIVIDINPDNLNNQIYVVTMGSYYKAEASIDSIRQVTEFAAKFK